MNFELILYSIIVGALGGGCIAAGVARMYHAPEIQGMGAFRTLGELNACNGDPIAHFSFGLGFFFNASASALAAGALTQDVWHRVIPNWSASILTLRGESVENTLHHPGKMFLVGSGLGALVVTFLNTTSSLIPPNLSVIAAEVLSPATSWLLNPVMPAIFWLSAMDAGKTTGVWATIVGGVSTLVTGNALPGIVLGILIGKSAEQNGYKDNVVRVLIAIVIVMFLAIAYFRGFFTQFGL